ncbi:WD domain, G-beta repeat-containing protein, partial [Frankia sp. CpI1-P]
PARPVRRATLSGHTTIVGQVSVTPDGRTALTASADHTAILWDLTRTHTLALHDSTVYAAALTPDGRTALTGSWDRTAIVWDLSDPARPVRRATLTGEELSRPVDGDR